MYKVTIESGIYFTFIVTYFSRTPLLALPRKKFYLTQRSTSNRSHYQQKRPNSHQTIPNLLLLHTVRTFQTFVRFSCHAFVPPRQIVPFLLCSGGVISAFVEHRKVHLLDSNLLHLVASWEGTYNRAGRKGIGNWCVFRGQEMRLMWMDRFDNGKWGEMELEVGSGCL